MKVSEITINSHKQIEMLFLLSFLVTACMNVRNEVSKSVCVRWYYLPNFLTDVQMSSEKSYFCVTENRQGDKIAIPVRYAPVNCSSVHHLFSYEVSFFSHFLLYSKLGLKREALV